MDYDYGWMYLRMVSNLVITFWYMVFAVLNLKHYIESDKGIMSAGFLSLSMVFLFCGVSGYFLDFLTYWIPTYRLSTVTKILGGVFSAFLVYISLATPFLKRIYARN